MKSRQPQLPRPEPDGQPIESSQLERRLDPLDRAGPDAELRGDLRMPLSPFARAFLMLASVLAAILGRPRILPLARARLSPALTRLTIIDRSNWAKTRTSGTWPLPLASRCPGLLVEVQANARPMDLPKEGDDVLQGPPKPIH